MRKQTASLPEFDNPPVSEVALSVEFQPLENWRSPHAGLYWARISSDYPHTDVQAALPSQIEEFGEKFWQRPGVRFEIVNPDVSRFWFLAEPPTRLIQVQRDRFIINWRKVRGDEMYPRYAKEIRPRFESEWARFKQFVSDQKLGGLDVTQCEITYVNDIVQGDGWQAFGDSLTLFSPWWGTGSTGFLSSPETLSIAGSFLMLEGRARLHFATQHVMRQIDQRETVQLRLVARGKPDSGADQDILRWMDIGHEWIVRGFEDLTSPKAHDLWKRKR